MKVSTHHRFAPTIFLITGGLLVWMAVFTFLYTFAAVACARRFADIEVAGLPITIAVTIATSLIAAAVNVLLLRRGYRMLAQSQLDEHSRFIGFVALTTSAIGLVALAMLAAPPFLVPACVQ